MGAQIAAIAEQENHFDGQEKRRIEDLQDVIRQCRPLAREGVPDQLHGPAPPERGKKHEQRVAKTCLDNYCLTI